MRRAIERINQLIECTEEHTKESKKLFFGRDYYKGMVGAYRECIQILKEEERRDKECDA